MSDPMKVMLMQVFLGNLIKDLKAGKIDKVIKELETSLEALKEDNQL